MRAHNLLLLLLFLLSNCGGLSDAGKVLRNEKIRTTDEFLVKKRDPLVLPPDYRKIPQPGNKDINEETTDKKIKEILKVDEEDKSRKNSSSVEDSILKKIGQWQIK